MRIALGSDHRARELRGLAKRVCEANGHVVRDYGTRSAAAVDYPDYAEKVGRAVAAGRAERGILICGTGIGMCIAANKVRGIRAAVCWDVFSARRSREHNDANVLCLGADMVAAPLATEIIETWLKTAALEGRHRRRVEKIGGIERRK